MVFKLSLFLIKYYFQIFIFIVKKKIVEALSIRIKII